MFKDMRSFLELARKELQIAVQTFGTFIGDQGEYLPQRAQNAAVIDPPGLGALHPEYPIIVHPFPWRQLAEGLRRRIEPSPVRRFGGQVFKISVFQLFGGQVRESHWELFNFLGVRHPELNFSTFRCQAPRITPGVRSGIRRELFNFRGSGLGVTWWDHGFKISIASRR